MLRSSRSRRPKRASAKADFGFAGTQLIADLMRKEAALTVAQVNLGYTRIDAPADGTVGERQVRPGQLVSPGTQVIAFVDKMKWVQANYRRDSAHECESWRFG